ncbi:response regulator [Paenibacillus cymbidii]|uniref:response regulator n=1 Tax=Paenibacillus cymbidii TaxID=1639034 RepID=UPI0010802F78|nr:response regulator [Paenibacillus cymbidii]
MHHVLIVDDEPWIRSSLEKRVTSASELAVVSEAAPNGRKALEWLELHHADICITDVRMPVMDGLELIRLINERFPWMVCIVVSSYDDFQYARESIHHGAIDYILKPIEQEVLNAALGKAIAELTRRRYHEAYQRVVRLLPHHRPMMERWVKQVQAYQLETMPLMVVDTLEMLESWADGAFYLLIPLSMVWLNLVCEELRRDKFDATLDEGTDSAIGEKTLPKERERSYFRLCAVRRLEEGALRLFGAAKEVIDHPARKVVEEIKRYVERHYAEKLSLQDIADVAEMSRNYSAGLFKQETGMTVWNYLVAVRMRKARELLLGTSMKVYEIAGEVGYENVVYFSQLFKEHFGMNPGEYKKRMEA